MLLLASLFAFTQVKAQGNTAATAVNNMVASYLGVKNALAADDNATTKAKASELLAAINAVPADKLNGLKKITWAEYNNKLAFDARHISESGAIDHQREYFTSLSKNMYLLLKSLKMNNTVVYEQYCPMKKASWLSESAAIKNPYYGKKMATCGKTIETLAATK